MSGPARLAWSDPCCGTRHVAVGEWLRKILTITQNLDALTAGGALDCWRVNIAVESNVGVNDCDNLELNETDLLKDERG